MISIIRGIIIFGVKTATNKKGVILQMKRAYVLIMLAVYSVCLSIFAEETSFRFPEFSELPKELLTPKDSPVTVAKDGTYLIGGKPTFLLTVKMAAGNPYTDLQPTSGYPESLKWLYETPLTYENTLRLGFNAIGVCASEAWFAKYADQKFGSGGKGYNVFFKTGLPIHQDMGGFTPWGPGLIAYKEEYKSKFEPDSCNAYDAGHGNHWVPYSVNHPRGREFYFAHWNNGIDEVLLREGRAFRYELFNEPAYNDPSPYNRKLFMQFLKEKYATVEKMNKIWNSSYPSFDEASKFKSQADCAGLYIDWAKFMEKSFAELCRDGAELVKKRVPDALVCVQPMAGDSLRFVSGTNINLFEVNKYMNSISTQTGGGVAFAANTVEAKTTIDTPAAPWVGRDALSVALTRALADGKPIHDDETYYGSFGAASVYQELMHGIGNSSIFEWGKRGYEWKTEENGRKSAEKFPWYILNPYAYPTEKLGSILETRKNILALSEFFVPRSRGISTPLAVMISYPTERMSGYTGRLSSNYANTVAGALLFSHYAFDGLFEEQLKSDRANRYRVIFAAGIKNTYPQSNVILEHWIRSGGILVGFLDTMNSDEYGHPIKTPFDLQIKESKSAAPIEWKLQRHEKIPGKLSGFPACDLEQESGWEIIGSSMSRKKLGDGWIYFIGVRFPDYSLAAVLGGILSQHGILPQCEIVKAENPAELAPGIEAAASERDGIYALILLNHDKYPKLIKVRPPAGKPSEASADILHKELLSPEADGSYLIAIAPQEAFSLYFAQNNKILTEKYGALPSISSAIQGERFAKMLLPEIAESDSGFNVKQSDMKMIDLRKVVNRHFVDGAANDGKGGWTDQGALSSLEGVPFGVQSFRNIPCDVIRWDMNDGRSCLVMDSQRLPNGFGVKSTEKIDVMEKVKALYFFHTSAWTKSEEHMMSYVLHCRSGKKIEISVIGNKNIADWYRVAASPMKAELAWKNLSGNGFYCVRWENPDPDEFVESVSIESKSGTSIPIVIGITVEKHSTQESAPPGFSDINIEEAWGKLKAAVKEDKIDVDIAENTSTWAGVMLSRKNSLPFKSSTSNKLFLSFEFRIGKDLYGKTGKLPQIQLMINQCGYIPFLDKDKLSKKPDEWKRIRIPLENWKKYKQGDSIDKILFQYREAAYSGFSIRRLAIEEESSGKP